MLSGPIPRPSADEKRKVTTFSIRPSSHALLRKMAEAQGEFVYAALERLILEGARSELLKAMDND